MMSDGDKAYKRYVFRRFVAIRFAVSLSEQCVTFCDCLSQESRFTTNDLWLTRWAASIQQTVFNRSLLFSFCDTKYTKHNVSQSVWPRILKETIGHSVWWRPRFRSPHHPHGWVIKVIKLLEGWWHITECMAARLDSKISTPNSRTCFTCVTRLRWINQWWS